MTTNTTTDPGAPMPATSIRDKIANLIAARDKGDIEIARLERAARLAEGYERRNRLATAGKTAQLIIDRADDTCDAVAAASADVTRAVRKLIDTVAAVNGQIADARAAIVTEGVQPHRHAVPPSPSDAGVGISDCEVIVGEQRIRGLDGGALVDMAVHAGHHDDTEPCPTPRIVFNAPTPEGPYWRLPNGSVMVATNPGPGFVELHRLEYLAACWGLPLRDLPDDLLDELTPAERARFAEQLLPAPDGQE